jgi:hypothetical protein
LNDPTKRNKKKWERDDLSLFSSWIFANYIADVSLALASFQSWNALKVFRYANFCAYVLAK